jgi:hypothetical protein
MRMEFIDGLLQMWFQLEKLKVHDPEEEPTVDEVTYNGKFLYL